MPTLPQQVPPQGIPQQPAPMRPLPAPPAQAQPLPMQARRPMMNMDPRQAAMRRLLGG